MILRSWFCWFDLHAPRYKFLIQPSLQLSHLCSHIQAGLLFCRHGCKVTSSAALWWVTEIGTEWTRHAARLAGTNWIATWAYFYKRTDNTAVEIQASEGGLMGDGPHYLSKVSLICAVLFFCFFICQEFKKVARMAGLSNDMKIKFQHNHLWDIWRYIKEYIVSALSWGQFLALFGNQIQQQVNKGGIFRPLSL